MAESLKQLQKIADDLKRQRDELQGNYTWPKQRHVMNGPNLKHGGKTSRPGWRRPARKPATQPGQFLPASDLCWTK